MCPKCNGSGRVIELPFSVEALMALAVAVPNEQVVTREIRCPACKGYGFVGELSTPPRSC